MPRWAIGVDAVYRLLILAGAILVAVLWFQAATRDEEADRNARQQACSSVYAATYSAWDAEALRSDEQAEAIFARIVVAAATDGGVSDGQLDRYQSLTDRAAAASENASEMARRRIGLGLYAAESVRDGGNSFQCPPIPERLMVTPIRPGQ